ncbi:MAG: CNNM domain-containing protein, partial [bacterium]
MPDVPIGALFAGLIVLLLLSAFFSGSETALMTVNRYRLRHLADQHHRGAVRVSVLLERPDRLIGLILLGNNFVNNLASSLATVIALSLMGRAGIALAAALLTLVMLIFCEVAPKTLAVLHPEKVAFPASTILAPLLRLFYPVVWIVNLFANGLLRLTGVRLDEGTAMPLSREELRTVVKEAGALIPKGHQQMLVGILDLEKVSVQDVMV